MRHVAEHHLIGSLRYIYLPIFGPSTQTFHVSVVTNNINGERRFGSAYVP